jgi:Spy/CpxP family protein refolding chaperone
MKTLILALAMVVGGTAIAQQQAHPKKERKPAEERATNSAQKMKKKLGLDDAQTAKIHDINLGIAQKNDAIRDNTSLTREQKMAQLKENQNARNVQYKEVLTADQYAKYEAWEKEKREKMQAKRAEKQDAKGGKGKPASPPTEEDEL